MFRHIAKVLAVLSMAFAMIGAHATTTSVSSAGGDYIFSWSKGLDFADDDFQVAGTGQLTFSVLDCCVAGDSFAYWLDGVKQTWQTEGMNGDYYTAVGSVFLTAGTHLLQLELTGLAPGFTTGGAYINFRPISPVPEPETYAMMIAGLGMVAAAMARRRKQQPGA